MEADLEAEEVDKEDDEVDDVEDEDDESYVPPFSLSQEAKQVNMQVGQSRSRAAGTLNPKQPGTKKKSKLAKPNDQEIDEFCRRHITVMTEEGHKTDDYVRALMLCTISKRATVWETYCTPFFFCCIVVGVGFFQWIQPGMNAENVCIDQTPVEVAGWSIPKIGNFPVHMLKLLEQFHARIHADWIQQSERMKTEHSMDGRELVLIPPPPDIMEVKGIIQFVHKQAYKIWITWPNACNEDMRGEVLDCMLNELKDIKSIKAFEKKVENIANNNILVMMQSDGKHHLPRYQELKGIVAGVDKPRTKRVGKPGNTKRKKSTKLATKLATSNEATKGATKGATRAATKATTKKKRKVMAPVASVVVSQKKAPVPDTSIDWKSLFTVDKAAVMHIKQLEQKLQEKCDMGTLDLMSLWKEECKKQG